MRGGAITEVRIEKDRVKNRKETDLIRKRREMKIDLMNRSSRRTAKDMKSGSPDP